MLYLTTMRGQFLDLIGIEIGVVTEEDGAGILPSIFFTVLCLIMA